MIDTLIKLGEQLSQNRSKWDDIIHIPKTNEKKTSYITNIIFDVDKGSIEINGLEEFSSKSPYEHKLLETLKRKAKKIYVTVLIDKIDHLKISLFGDDNASKGQLMDNLETIAPNLKETTFYNALSQIFSLKKEAKKLDKKYIKQNLSLGNNSELIFCYASIKSGNINDGKITELSKLKEYSEFLNKKFFETKVIKNHKLKKLDYSLGTKKQNIKVAKFKDGENLNKMFVETTINFANDFKKENYYKNYQLSHESIKYLDRASSHLLKHMRFKIAGLNHVVIPQFLSKTDADFENIFDDIYNKNDLLFNKNLVDKLNTSIKDEANDKPYWLNYLAIDSDGKSFKTSNLIKDVSKPYLIKIIKTIDEVNTSFGYQFKKELFNFYKLYQYIPVRENTKKKKDRKYNIALDLYSRIFQQRPIEKSQIYQLFNQYIKCQKSGQFDSKKYHNSYSNIYQNSSFDFSIKNAVTMYSAFFMLLDKLKLLKSDNIMENTTNTMKNKERSQKINEEIEAFFNKMKYTESQKALFYLGRVLNNIAYAQYRKGHASKPIMNKVNYNGMDRDDIRRLRIDLEEKANQYDILEKTHFSFSKFTAFFNYNEWKLDPEEAVFFLLAGYSFFISND